MKKNAVIIFSAFIFSLLLSPKAFSDERSELKEINVTTLKEQREAFKEKIQDRKEKFQENLEKIKDERKKKIIERINENFASRNEKWVTHFDNVLKRLTEILEKIETRAQKAKENGKDMSSIETAISNAKTAIEEAQTAVNAQREKDYTIVITDEENAKEEVSVIKEQLKTDLTNTREKVKNARDAVHQAAVTLGESL